MTHLRIELNGITEEVSYNLIKKLYDLAVNGTLDNTSNLVGRLNSDFGKLSIITYLTALYPDLHITATSMYVDFVDPLTESICVNKWGDGRGVTLALLLSVGSFDGSVFGGSNIEHFDEFQYFTNPSFINPQQNMFENCTNLKSITYPPQFNYFPGKSHLNNTSLQSIDLRNTIITSVGQNGFDSCSTLASVYLPQTCIEIKLWSFSNCHSLSTLDTSNIKTFGRCCLDNCSSLLSLDMSSATSTDYLSFRNCTSLTSVTLNPLLTRLAEQCFVDCSSLSNIDFSNITNFGAAAFLGCTSLGANTDLDLDLDGKTFGSNVFRGTGYRSITLHETTKHQISSFSGSGLYDAFGALMPNLTKFDLSDTKLTDVTYLYSNNLTTLILPETYTGPGSRGTDWGTRLLYIICLQLNPASVTKPNSYYGFVLMPANCAIYVPDSVYLNYVDAWITNSDDPISSSRIKPISELPSSVTWYTKEHPSS